MKNMLRIAMMVGKYFFNREYAERENGLEVVYSAMQNKMKQDYMAPSVLSACNSRFNEGPIYVHIDGENDVFSF